LSLSHYEKLFSNLNLNRSGSKASPHKVAMLSAVMDLIENGTLHDNRIAFDSTLTAAFTIRFNELRSGSDTNNPHLPFYHLGSEGFWNFKLVPGKSDSWNRLKSSPTGGAIRSHVLYAFLDDELFELLRIDTVRNHLKNALHQNLIITDQSRKISLRINNAHDDSEAWDWLEYEVCAAEYFSMLTKEMHSIKYDESAQIRALSKALVNHSTAAIDLQLQHISAILLQMGFPYISRFKPNFKYQIELKEVILAQLAAQQSTMDDLTPINSSIKPPYTTSWENILDLDLPERIAAVIRPDRRFIARIQDYAKRESMNRHLGESGEDFIYTYEKKRLTRAGRDDLANEVEWSSKEKGDGLGYDLKSFVVNDETSEVREHFIEIKTTVSGKYQPFFVTDNELAFSKKEESYSLFRVYDFPKSPRFFQLRGPIDQNVNLSSELYKASFTIK
jgi:hypothetical protein